MMMMNSRSHIPIIKAVAIAEGSGHTEPAEEDRDDKALDLMKVHRSTTEEVAEEDVAVAATGRMAKEASMTSNKKTTSRGTAEEEAHQ